MHPLLFHVGVLNIHWYGVCLALAFLAGLANWTLVGQREGRSATFCSDLLFWVMVSGIVGGRLAYVLANLSYYAREPQRVLFLWEGGLIYYGGFAGGILAVYGFARSRRIPFLNLLDFALTSLPLSHAIGRVGCFLNGCCFGAVSSRWPGVVFPHASLPWQRQVELGLIPPGATHSLPVHPVQLYEALFALLLYPLLLFVYRRRRRDGEVLGVYLVAYPLGRFALEFLRGTERLRAGGFSLAQILSLALVVVGLAVLLTSRHASTPGARRSQPRRAS